MPHSKLKSTIKGLIPPIFNSLLRKINKDQVRYVGSFVSLPDARKHSTGYDADLILEKVSSALLAVKSGSAAYERDGVLFDQIVHPFPLLTGLFRAAAENDGQLTVLDFGGSLGSSYFQCRDMLSVLPVLTWCIVEQEKFVQRGQQLFESEDLHFFYTIEACLKAHTPNVMLFASVLQYVDDPDAMIRAAMHSNAQYIIIDRTPFSDRPTDHLCVQHVPARIYKASYPCRILSQPRIQSLFDEQFDLISYFDALGGEDYVDNGLSTLPFQYKGMIWRRRQQAFNELAHTL